MNLEYDKEADAAYIYVEKPLNASKILNKKVLKQLAEAE